METAAALNPFPGLRPFEPDEDHLFFGREREIDELLRRLRQTRFLPVIGTSGSGKSSLVRCGLIPSLQGGLMVKAGSAWRVAIFRPGGDPIGNLASSLNAPDVLGSEGEFADTNRVLLEATLHRSTLGLVEAVRQARIPTHENILLVVDQFEELFRFRRSSGIANSRDEAVAFVNLLLEAARLNGQMIYVVPTMRPDFIGDCMECPGLPEAVNAGQYLVPRMTRDELRSAITCPVAVAGGEISPRLVVRLLNDVGDDPDQLPVLQHALMRTWDYWKQHRHPGEPVDLVHYEAVGTMRRALSLHAEEAYEEAGSSRGKQIAERLFKALTDTSTDHRGVRRPASVEQLAAICSAGESEIISAVEVFRRPGRSFLTPPVVVPLEPRSIVDLSHESLMRCWTRLIDWAEQERISANFYVRLARSAAWHEEGTAGLWRDPELEFGLQWKEKNRPAAAWAERYAPSFQRAMEFLDSSEIERNRLAAEQEKQRKRKLTLAWSIAGVLGALFLTAVYLGSVAWNERLRAENNLQLAKKAVDEMLSSAGREPARVAAETPQMEEFRQELLEKAKEFYTRFSDQKPDSEMFRKEMAMAHFRLGDISRLLEQTEPAIKEYKKAAVDFENLAKDFPGNPEYRALLASAHNWLGETERPSQSYRSGAEEAYGAAIRLQEDLLKEFPDNAVYRLELGRTHYNRGILRSENRMDDSDYREAIRLLEPLAQKDPSPALATGQARQELARTYNNLGLHLAAAGRQSEAEKAYERAVAIHEALTRSEPSKREYKLELAKFYGNLAILLQEQGRLDSAKQRNLQALDLFEQLAIPSVSLGTDLAQAYNLRGLILESQQSLPAAEREYERSLDGFERLEKAGAVVQYPEFHLKYGQALFNLAVLRRGNKNFRDAHGLLLRAVAQHLSADSKVDLAFDYRELARSCLDLDVRAEAFTAIENLSRLLPQLPAPYREQLTKSHEELLRRGERESRPSLRRSPAEDY